MTEDKRKDDDFSIGDESTEVEDRKSAVSKSGVRQKLGLVGLLLLCLLALYYFFAGSSDDNAVATKEPVIKEEKSISSEDLIKSKSVPIDHSSRALLPPDLPKLPESPGIPNVPVVAKQIEVKENILPTPPKLPGSTTKTKTVEAPKRVGSRQNRQTPMLVIAGGGVGSSKADVKSSGINITDPSQILDPNKLEELKKSLQNQTVAATEESELQRTSNQKLATRVGELDYIVGEGKMIDAVLETSINTDLKGKIRAVVSRDIFSESGERTLIPKGSRLIGEYSTDISLIQGRVDIFWTRVILPWGIDVVLDNFPGVDQLGRAGVAGIVNNKFLSIMSTSITLAAIRVGTGMLVDKVMGTEDVTINNTRKKGKKSAKDSDATDDAEYKIKASPGAILAMQAVQDASKQATDYVNRYADTKPTIKINQGTRLKVFVNQDIVFPKSAFREYKIVN